MRISDWSSDVCSSDLKEGANPQRVRERLLEHELVVEEMGGDVQNVEVSALKKTGLDKLLDAIAVQAEIMELKANPDRAAEGTVVEAKLDKRSEERRVGKECVGPCRYRWAPYP